MNRRLVDHIEAEKGGAPIDARLPDARPGFRGLLAMVCLAALCAGCATVDPVPFTQFAAALKPLRTETDTRAGTAAAASRADLLQKVAGGEVSLADLQLQFGTAANPFAATYSLAEPEANFTKFIRFRQGLAALNDAMIGYAEPLVVLAGGGKGGDIIPTTAQFDKLAQDLNANSGTAARALGLRLDPGRQALLSTAAIEIFKAYIESRRREALAEAIMEVQPRVEEFSTAAQEAVRLLATLINTDYLDKILKLSREVNKTKPVNAAPVLELNDATQQTLATLEVLANSYRALPAAHRDLAAAASKKATGLAGIVVLGDQAARLNGLITQRTTANEAAAAASTKK